MLSTRDRRMALFASVMVALLAVLPLTTGGLSARFIQQDDATPVAEGTPAFIPEAIFAQTEVVLPVALYRGTCEGERRSPVNVLTESAIAEVNLPAEAPENVPVSLVLESQTTTASFPMDELARGQYMIGVVGPDDRALDREAPLVACGEILGAEGTARMLVGMREMNDSGYHGIAIVESGDAGVTITLYLAAPSTMLTDVMATPAA